MKTLPDKKTRKIFLNIFVVVVSIIMFASCANVVEIEECVEHDPYGFWWGLMHGFITPFSFIISLFKDNVTIYAVNNNGIWYNLGYVLGVMMIFGGGGKASKSRRK